MPARMIIVPAQWKEAADASVWDASAASRGYCDIAPAPPVVSFASIISLAPTGWHSCVISTIERRL